MYTVRFVFFITLSIAPQVLLAQLQWQQIGSFPNRIQAVYFTDELHGFVSIGTVPGNVQLVPKLFRTVDGGANWTETQVENLTSGYGIQDMFMSDTLNGWACGGCGAGYSLWRTGDGGMNWNTVGSSDGRYSVAIRKTAAGIVVSDFYQQHLRISKDGGTTFNDVFQPPKNDVLLGMDFTDDLHGVLIGSFRAGNPWYYTSDGGETWTGTTVNMESWSVHGQKGSPNFFAAPEGWSNQSYTPSSCYRSTDYGKTWSIVAVFPAQMIGHITGVGSTIYTQSEYPPGSTAGVYRSVDSGMTWTLLGGPNTSGDSRFIALPSSCHKNIIFAGGEDFNLYKAYDNAGAASQSLTGVRTQYQSAATIRSGDTANVQVGITFPANSKAVGFIPTEVEYSLRFDPTVVELSHLSDIIPPIGWVRKSVLLGDDSVDVTLADTIGAPISDKQNFGSIGFFALPPSAHHGTSVILSRLILRSDCATIIGLPDIESGILRGIKVVTSGVDEKIIFHSRLQIFPNPAQQTIRISSPDGTFPRSLIIFDNTGNIVRTIVQFELNNSEISVSDLSSGSYSLVAEYSEGNAILKFSIVK